MVSIVCKVVSDILEQVLKESFDSSLRPAFLMVAKFAIDKALHFLKFRSMLAHSPAVLPPRHVGIFGDSAAKLVEARLLKHCD